MVDIQSRFAFDVGKLLAHIEGLGYQATFSEAFRSKMEAWVNSLPPGCMLHAFKSGQDSFYFSDVVGGLGIQNSLHCQRLAVDLNIFINGDLVEDKATLQPIGDYWESLRPGNSWGGNWTSRLDTDHFEHRPQ
jgi:hypothetical protein